MVRSRLGPNRVSERRICRVLSQSRSTQRYVRRQPGDNLLNLRLPCGGVMFVCHYAQRQ
jgi:hypothetical protein